ncbi:Fe-S cluster assembly protein SufD [Ammoniphilus sp. CFH 90114]|uniref:Fe-S cluster assembly protein SufD n=1 Tax=Ammoniphilus sp. CFH 90114 TaxID=2493665 RepID=UPI00100F2913|nr:Fe-S cluster assembly protein SufD [Ammoniphilus sp. CFH 90114]RXT05720.1 Fe-S cluster assembly protein SufD [Ammoniphilus sp. CFH 90114]
MSVEMKLRFDRDAITQYSKQSGEPEWMTSLRLQGYDQSLQLELPKLDKTKLDSWNVDGFVPFRTHNAVTSTNELPQEVQALIAQQDGVEKAILVQQDASTVYTYLPEALKSQGVVFQSLQSALTTHGEVIKKHFMQKDSKVNSHKLAALHTAAWSGGVFLYVPKNVEVKVPVQAVFYATGTDAGLFPHVMIVAETHSSVSYTDAYVNLAGTEGVHNGVAEVHVGPGAKVKYTTVRTFEQTVTDYIYRHATVEQDGRMEWILGEMNDSNTVTQNTTHLLGKGSTVDSKLVTVGSGTQKENVVSKVVHTGKHSDSQVLVKGVLKDEASAILNGITFIEKGATKANGEQAENVLMLSPKSRGDANPILLIDEDDVTAGHAASAGQINPMQIFYLMSRGISKREAQRLIINGFVAPVVDEIGEAGVRDLLERTIERKVSQ